VTRFGRGRRWRRFAGSAPRIWAHRGDSAHQVENTMEAFAAARAAGADGIELDVQLSSDGMVFVFHDEDLKRLAGRDARVASMPWSELSKVSLSGARMPRLADVLDASRELEVNVEIKSSGAGRAGALPAAAVRVIRDLHASDRVLVSSFDPWALVQVHAVAPELATAYLFHSKLPMPARRGWLAPWIGASAMHPEHVLCSAAQVAAWRRAGYAVNVWTVDDPATLRALAAWGVDGVFANDPAAARRAITSSSSSSSRPRDP
jgi:glycerophosphoryl diester phosphodiesterase